MNKRMGLAIASLATTAALTSLSLRAEAPPNPHANSAAAGAGACAKLADLRLKAVTVVSATNIAQGAPVPSSGLLPMFGKMDTVARGLPEFCRVVGKITPEPGSDIGFEVWLPANWDGRLHGIGIGGFAGVIDYFALGQAVKAGQTGVATNTGHTGHMQDYSWAPGHPHKVRDYAWRAIHLSTVAAKQLIAARYGKAPDKSYFVGCSGGGRQGLMEAARYPEDYDAIVSGAPAANFTDLTLALTNATQAQLAPGAAIRPEQARLLQEEVLRQCDAGDGQADGLVADPRQCRFDAAKLSCKTSTSSLCFSDNQLAALARIHAGPATSAGRHLAAGYLPSGAEVGVPSPQLGWEGYLLLGGNGRSGGSGLADGMLGALIHRPFATTASFDFDRHPAQLRAASRELDVPTDLSRFFARGGKLILWHGWGDAAIPPEATLKYYDDVLRRSGKQARDAVRLFMVPGMQHCAGGPGPDSFGHSGAPQVADTPERSMVAALQTWREGARPAPEMVIGRLGHGDFMRMSGRPESQPERQRLLCAWPKRAVLSAGQDPNRATSYTCN